MIELGVLQAFVFRFISHLFAFCQLYTLFCYLLVSYFFSQFQTFLGQKYGYRPFPSMIAATEFEELLNVVNLDSEKDLLLKWFRKDENLVPPKYVLQPIRDILPDYRNFTKTQMERNAAKTAWWSEFEQLQVILRQSARKTLVEESEIEKYIISGKNCVIIQRIQPSNAVRSLGLWVWYGIAENILI